MTGMASMTPESIFSPIANAATRNQIINDSDYIAEDGFLHCGVCHEKKQGRLESGIFKGRTVAIQCKCAMERAEKERIEKDRMEKRSHCFFSKEQYKNTFENDNGSCEKLYLAKEYVSHWDKVSEKKLGLLIWGGLGNGKTYSAECIANALIDKGVGVKFITLTQVLNDIQNRDAVPNVQAYINDICGSGVLIIDDLGVERDTPYAIEQTFNLINTRYKSKRILICTTNLSLDEMRNCENLERKRIYDRVLELCIPVCFTGDSIREQNAEKNIAELRAILEA